MIPLDAYIPGYSMTMTGDQARVLLLLFIALCCVLPFVGGGKR